MSDSSTRDLAIKRDKKPKKDIVNIGSYEEIRSASSSSRESIPKNVSPPREYPPDTFYSKDSRIPISVSEKHQRKKEDEAVESKLRGLSKENELLKSKYDKLLKHEVDLSREIGNLKEEILKLEAEGSKDEKLELTKHLGTLKNEINQLNKKITNKNDTIEELELLISEKNLEIVNLKNQVEKVQQNYENHLKECNESKINVSKDMSRIESEYKTMVKDLNDQNQILKDKLNQAYEEIEILKSNNKDSHETIENTKNNHQEELENLRNEKNAELKAMKELNSKQNKRIKELEAEINIKLKSDASIKVTELDAREFTLVRQEERLKSLMASIKDYYEEKHKELTERELSFSKILQDYKMDSSEIKSFKDNKQELSKNSVNKKSANSKNRTPSPSKKSNASDSNSPLKFSLFSSSRPTSQMDNSFFEKSKSFKSSGKQNNGTPNFYPIQVSDDDSLFDEPLTLASLVPIPRQLKETGTLTSPNPVKNEATNTFSNSKSEATNTINDSNVNENDLQRVIYQLSENLSFKLSQIESRLSESRYQKPHSMISPEAQKVLKKLDLCI
ncbi:hypothetical protein O9G_001138 [Rozella allomycis CSF55]|uniref:Uncharacterized protein n=1 Tax=Rozella allomycis (strain CSF55) TaxID=988480 RepID=A0A075AXB8_ROZAC|nr:hypothetical protein O9G_001138 [Rozella allomycis CSF55]|eukprot:EPZ33169.1 hypothetical protein O9G_001138 [Rozella allomycis CSF55]